MESINWFAVTIIFVAMLLVIDNMWSNYMTMKQAGKENKHE